MGFWPRYKFAWYPCLNTGPNQGHSTTSLEAKSPIVLSSVHWIGPTEAKNKVNLELTNFAMRLEITLNEKIDLEMLKQE